MRSFAACFGIGLCRFDARTNYDHVNIFRGTLEDIVAYIAADDVAFEAEGIDGGSKQTKVGGLEVSNKFFLTGDAHNAEIL